MTRELIIRHVPGYGYLPIVRDVDLETGRQQEIYRGDFRKSAILAAYAGERFMPQKEVSPCPA